MNELVVIIRPSFMKFCQDGCQAALFNHLLFWIAWKNRDQAQEIIQSAEITYYATNEELIEHMANVWSDKKVRTEINALVDLGVIGRTRNQKWKTDRTKHFYFGKEQYTKLVELCKKHQVCLAHIGLPKEIINLLATFNKSIECPCTKQVVNLLEANGKFTECNEPILPNANGRIDRNDNKDNSKDNSKDNYERMNSARVQNKVENFHPSILPSVSQNSSSGEKGNTQEKEVVFTELEEQVYQIAKDLKLARLRKNEKNKAYCAQLVEKDVLTHEKMKRLMGYSRKRLNKGPEAELYLGNLVRDLDGWLQVEEAKHLASTDIFGNKPCSEENTHTDRETSLETVIDVVEDHNIGDEELPPVTNEEIADKIRYFSQRYHDEIHTEDNVLRAEQIRLSFGVSREFFYDTLYHAQSDTDRTSCTMTEFFRCLEWSLQAS